MELHNYSASCPYCGELIELLLDDSVPEQEYIEDCSVCCRPINIKLLIHDDGGIQCQLTRDDE